MSFLLHNTLGRVILAVGALAVVVVGWTLISPLFIDRTVAEEFPELVAAAGMEDVEMDDPMPAVRNRTAGPTEILSGTFVDADRAHQGSGRVKVVAFPEPDDGGDAARVLRFEDFRATNGPDLFVWLTNVDDPIADRRRITDEGNWVNLGRLKGNVGEQNYDIPADVDLDEFTHVVIWCRAFSVLFSPATLSAS